MATTSATEVGGRIRVAAMRRTQSTTLALFALSWDITNRSGDCASMPQGLSASEGKSFKVVRHDQRGPRLDGRGQHMPVAGIREVELAHAALIAGDQAVAHRLIHQCACPEQPLSVEIGAVDPQIANTSSRISSVHFACIEPA